MRRTLYRLLLFGIGGLILVCLVISIPVWLLQTNPPAGQQPPWNSPQTVALARRACFDCHSNETTWPWYSRVPPVSWIVTQDVVRGREHLNFSMWGSGGRGEGGSRREREGGDFAEVIQDGSMPPAIYLVLHPSARLGDAEKQQLIQGLQASLR